MMEKSGKTVLIEMLGNHARVPRARHAVARLRIREVERNLAGKLVEAVERVDLLAEAEIIRQPLRRLGKERPARPRHLEHARLDLARAHQTQTRQVPPGPGKVQRYPRLAVDLRNLGRSDNA